MPGVASGCASYISWSVDSRSAIVETIADGPNRRAIHIRILVRQEGRSCPVAMPAASKCSRQTAPWRTSASASRRYSSRRTGFASAAAIAS